jgi:hypothetical protein
MSEGLSLLPQLSGKPTVRRIAATAACDPIPTFERSRGCKRQNCILRTIGQCGRPATTGLFKEILPPEK